jgi:hypothetical protein
MVKNSSGDNVDIDTTVFIPDEESGNARHDLKGIDYEIHVEIV